MGTTNVKKRFSIPSELKQSLIAVFVGLLIGAIVIAFSGANPLSVYYEFVMSAVSSGRSVGNVIGVWSIYTLTGIAVAFAFRTGLFNIGVAGQMIFAALMAFTFMNTIGLDLPGMVAIPIAIIIAVAAGSALGFFIGMLKSKWNVHEVVSSIMINWIMFEFNRWAVHAWGFGHTGVGGEKHSSISLPETHTLRSSFLNDIFERSNYISWAFVIAIVVTVVAAFVINKTLLGYKLRVTGQSKGAAKNSGINANRMGAMSMAISGGIAGLAAIAYNMGFQSSISTPDITVLPQWGFDGIVVALIAFSKPKWVWLPALLFAVIYNGQSVLTLVFDVRPETVNFIFGSILYSVGISAVLLRVISFKKGGAKNGHA